MRQSRPHNRYTDTVMLRRNTRPGGSRIREL